MILTEKKNKETQIIHRMKYHLSLEDFQMSWMIFKIKISRWQERLIVNKINFYAETVNLKTTECQWIAIRTGGCIWILKKDDVRHQLQVMQDWFTSMLRLNNKTTCKTLLSNMTKNPAVVVKISLIIWK